MIEGRVYNLHSCYDTKSQARKKVDSLKQGRYSSDVSLRIIKKYDELSRKWVYCIHEHYYKR